MSLLKIAAFREMALESAEDCPTPAAGDSS